MKNVIIAVGLVVVLVLVSVISLVMYSGGTRQNEIEEALTVAVEQALENLKMDKQYTIGTEEEFVADFTQRLVVGLNSDSDITVNVLAVDIGKGLLDVEVIESYRQLNGKPGSASYRKTVILEEIYKDPTKYFSVSFKVDKGYAVGEFVDYKVFTVGEGKNVIFPGAKPSLDGYTFKGWSLTEPSAENSYKPETVATDEDMAVSKNLVFYAVFE